MYHKLSEEWLKNTAENSFEKKTNRVVLEPLDNGNSLFIGGAFTEKTKEF